jgi:hypothetical protein
MLVCPAPKDDYLCHAINPSCFLMATLVVTPPPIQSPYNPEPPIAILYVCPNWHSMATYVPDVASFRCHTLALRAIIQGNRPNVVTCRNHSVHQLTIPPWARSLLLSNTTSTVLVAVQFMPASTDVQSLNQPCPL